jgi:hypothetical protein
VDISTPRLDSLTLTAEVKDGSAKASVQSKDADTTSLSDYKPVAGDVVEFDDVNRVSRKGIVFRDSDGDLIVTHGSNWHETTSCRNFVKTGSTDCIPNDIDPWKGQEIAKAYFAKPTFTGSYEPKIGDRVEIIGDGGAWPGTVGDTDTVDRVDGDGTFRLTNGHYYYLSHLKPAE